MMSESVLNVGDKADGSGVDPQAVGDLLRDCEHAMSRVRTSIVAQVGVDLDYFRLDLHRLTEAITAVKAALPHFPPDLPLTPEQEERARAWIGRALDRLDG